MNKFTNPMTSLKVASPCSQDWEAMAGDNQKRYCGECNLNVYNLSGMTQTEAEQLLTNAEGRLCVRFYQRADGTILTQDCPVGWAGLKRRVSRTAAAVASLVFGVIGGLGITSLTDQSDDESMGTIAYGPTPKPRKVKPPTPKPPIMGGIAAPTPTPKPTPKTTPGEFIMGDVALPATSATPIKKDLKPTIKRIIETQG